MTGFDLNDIFELERKFFSAEFLKLGEASVIDGNKLHQLYRIWATATDFPVLKYSTMKSRFKKFFKDCEGQTAQDFFAEWFGDEYVRESVRWTARFPGIRNGALMGLAVDPEKMRELHQIAKEKALTSVAANVARKPHEEEGREDRVDQEKE